MTARRAPAPAPVTAHDLSHLGAYQASARLVVRSADTAAFTLRTVPLPDPAPGREEAVRASSRHVFGPEPDAPAAAAASAVRSVRIRKAPRP